MSGVKNQKWSIYKIKRRRVLRYLTELYNRKKHEALFKEDMKELDKIQACIDLFWAIDYNNPVWAHKGKCPICGSNKIRRSKYKYSVFLSNEGRKKDSKEDIIINHCDACGFTNVENLYSDRNNRW